MLQSLPRTAPNSLLEQGLIRALKSFNGLLHVVLAIALVAASAMVVWEFFIEAWAAFQKDQLAHGFLHALGVLFIVWTLSALISAEVDYVRTNRFHLRVFLEVAMITLLRQLIVRPVQAVAGDVQTGDWSSLWQYGLLLAGLITVAIAHRLIGDEDALKR
ncbi:phosphate-starvation-inducible protein E [Azospirillum brasilense]|uniref:Phosphate-starvation-inducible protein E n=1 Tax=Azospirillum brasilense TaxID=192 RepID=A0A560C304_AZOBR|nr:phosphate-starvation-inducible PsiE family protein [Azospirillum brasilense]MBK3735433.1 hypothetical protein [Azospirillum brasilense]TWA79236.1 phosphate-starvation-inducible protein E [Azospirillum brasilense]